MADGRGQSTEGESERPMETCVRTRQPTNSLTTTHNTEYSSGDDIDIHIKANAPYTRVLRCCVRSSSLLYYHPPLRRHPTTLCVQPNKKKIGYVSHVCFICLCVCVLSPPSGFSFCVLDALPRQSNNPHALDLLTLINNIYSRTKNAHDSRRFSTLR